MKHPRPLNIVCATTRQWNPGDEWIAAGIRRLLRAALAGREANWILYDRSPGGFTTPWVSPERTQGRLGNAYSAEALLQADLVIAAGTPEWHGPHMRSLFERHSGTPWLVLGAGTGEGPLELDPQEVEVLRQALVTVRDPDTAAELHRYGVDAHLLPCPALFCAELEVPPRRLRRVAVVLQSDRVVNQRISPELKSELLRLVDQLALRWDVAIVCNYIDEFQEFSNDASVPVHYHYDSAEYAEILSAFDLVISSRLHSGILANSLLKPAVVVNPSRRVRSAAKVLPYLFCCEASAVIPRIEAIPFQETVRQLFNWKRRIASDYDKVLSAGLSQYGLHQLS